jgi:hypothetical protein
VAPPRGEIRHRSQRDADDERWARCGCGMACLQMILGARGDVVPALAELGRAAQAYGAYATEPQRVGYGPLIYVGFVEFVAAEHALAARVAAPLTMDGLIASVSGEEVVLASVSAEISDLPLVPARRGGHLVLVFDASADGRVGFLDPSGEPASVWLERAIFERYFAGRGIAVALARA